ncbi:MAG: hypothetical protein MUF05_00130 [Candidatus Omnitrophica bacterium]|jgi:RNA recognition motif-containing protein|nr:hypothetical protein [Candidatus Omnitrophota bacterium]
MNIFVGNLSFDAKETDVYQEFMAHGKVSSIVIVMDKKGKHSRGFGFVEMPDDEEARRAIEALNGKEILGRAINVMPALPKKPEREVPKEKKPHHEYQRPEHKELHPKAFTFERTGEYKKGRRTRSFMMRRAESGITGPMPERKFKENPMRWRKKAPYSKPWEKNRGEKPPEGQARPWQKREGTTSNRPPWQKREGTTSNRPPWQKREGATSRPPWQKSEDKTGLWQKREGPVKPWQKKEGARRPWQRSESAGAPASKPWVKREGTTSNRPPWQKRASGVVRKRKFSR